MRALLLWCLAASASGADGNLRVGASLVDVTPAPAELPAPYKTIYDRIYVRTILLDNGSARAAIVVADVPAIQAGIFNGLVTQISRDPGCPPENVMLAATHTHNSIRVNRTVAVVKFENTAGEPIAFVINYGIEPVVVMDSNSEISEDVPGAVSRYVEERYGADPVDNGVLEMMGEVNGNR